MPSSIQKPVRLALLTALLAGLSVQASAADPFLSVTSSMSNLNFQLIDLDLNDGVAPSLSVLQDGRLLTYTVAPEQAGFNSEGTTDTVALTGQYAGSPFTDLSLTRANGTLSTSPNLVVLKSSIGQKDLNTQTFNTTNVYDDGPTRLTVTSSESTTSSGSDQIFLWTDDTSNVNMEGGTLAYGARLSANTALIITGQSTVSLHADRSFLDAQASALGEADTYSSADSSVVGAVSLMILGGSGGSADYNQSNYFNRSGMYFEANMTPGITTFYDGRTGEYFDSSDLVLDRTITQTFSVVGFNNSSVDSNMSVEIGLRSSTKHIFNAIRSTEVETLNPDWVPETPIPTIPEPSTYALMALGLVGLAWANRRQRPTKQV